MSLATRFHGLIDAHNVLSRPTRGINEYLLERRTLYKLALVVNHLFRAAAMTAFMTALPFSTLVNVTICLLGSLFYRLTVETHCAYKFALPAVAGSIAFLMARPALPLLVSGVAFATLSAFAVAYTYFIPLTAYAVYIGLTVSYDVDNF